MNRNLKQSSAIAYLRQLCCSGLDKEIVIQEFLRAVQSSYTIWQQHIFWY